VSGVELILAAVAAGATAGVTDATSGAIRDAYTGLREMLRRSLTSRGEQALQALDAEETSSGVWQVRLSEDLIRSGADQDEPLLAAARELLARVEAAGRTEVQRVDLRGAQGVQFGNNNTQHNNYH
jgi:hypothetical protein